LEGSKMARCNARNHRFRRNGLIAIVLNLSLIFPMIAYATGCQTGADALSNAYVRMNPLIALFFGSVEDYVSQNPAHFQAGGDSTACAQHLSQKLYQGAISSFDPADQIRRDELNAELGGMGITPGNQPTSPSQQLYAMAQMMDRLAYALPFAAIGDFGPLRTPLNEIEQMQEIATQMFALLMQDPEMRSTLAMIEPQIRELTNIEYRMILSLAQGL
jgi:hypothetical protein